jgi:hypothetical protein
MTDPWTNLLPFDHDAADNVPRVLGAASEPFLYIGKAHRVSISAYVRT